MKRIVFHLGPVLLTLVAVSVSAFVGLHLWNYYTTATWTRDGHVRADIVQVAPDVSGLVTEVYVKDNAQVHRGQVLFVIDPQRFDLALQQAEATAASYRAALAEARREAARNRSLVDVVARETVEATQARVEQGEAALAQAEAAVAVARLNIERSRVVSPVNGFVNDRMPRPGDYANAGKPALSAVDSDSLYVEGYFEETKLPRIRIGDPVDVRIMGEHTVLQGHVESIAAGIEDRNRSAGSNLLPNVNPTFNWVRLAQRVPVRVMLENVPAEVQLVSGRTVTVGVRGERASEMTASRETRQ
ncbi:HlyD family secretion protein [Paraburkholderia sp. FT54]|uniref:HlyD family secretion protein n=1 Tax=Paraburkholderia sp. FT54 TaxID=3074437 RepID=UPI0028773C90|nr:HlyD family secretion protein [Paraburkholderia sp. FT54]WNC94522.1 HlyD family secretion protein [Paraburkholderia sp. FT54]